MLVKRRFIVLVVTCTALVLWMFFIFSMSAQSGSESVGVSGRVISVICDALIPSFDDISELAKAELISALSLPIRKLAHFSEYFILGVISSILFMQLKKEVSLKINTSLIAFVFGVLYAITDELHQRFVPGRACAFTDVIIESLGVLCGCICCYLIYMAVTKNRQKIK